MTLVIAKRTEEDFARWLATEWGFLAGLGTIDGEPLELEAYQLAFLQNRSRFRWVSKSRQVGYSFLFALESLARCHLRPKHTALFVSYNLEDAKEKIVIAKQIHEDLPLAYQKRVVVDSRTELAFESNGAAKGISRILSVPSKAPRGKKGDVYLDELAHYANDRDVYRGSTALILRSNGQLTGCSTPLGRRGVFHEIAVETGKYRHHWRQNVPWWLSRAFCTDPKRAAVEAPHMPTAERVEKFGTQAIAEQLTSLPLEDFQQEFECSFLDESTSFYPYELLLPCLHDDLVLAADATDIPRPRGRLVAGYDVGRVHDRSALAVFEEIDNRYICRLLRNYDQMPFAAQESELRRLLDHVPIARLSIDRTGLGAHLAENIAREFPQVVPEAFSNEAKERWALDLKLLFQGQRIVLPRERALISEFHGIERKVLPSGKIAFDAPRNSHGHADRFWAIALAVQKERGAASRGPTKIGVRVIG